MTGILLRRADKRYDMINTIPEITGTDMTALNDNVVKLKKDFIPSITKTCTK